MDFTLTPEQQLLRDGLTKFLSARYDLENSREVAKIGAGWQPEIWRSFAEELGVIGQGDEIQRAVQADPAAGQAFVVVGLDPHPLALGKPVGVPGPVPGVLGIGIDRVCGPSRRSGASVLVPHRGCMGV